jgi:hypothetical protein
VLHSEYVTQTLFCCCVAGNSDPYLPEMARDLVAMLPRRDPALACVTVDSSASVVEYLTSPEICSKCVRLLFQNLVEGLDQDKHCIVHECRLGLQKQITRCTGNSRICPLFMVKDKSWHRIHNLRFFFEKYSCN